MHGTPQELACGRRVLAASGAKRGHAGSQAFPLAASTHIGPFGHVPGMTGPAPMPLGADVVPTYSYTAMGLDTVELVLETEEHFGISVPEERAAMTLTVEEFACLICELRAEASAPLPYPEVLAQLQGIIASMFAIPIERIVPSARFVKDLGLDQ